MDKELLVKRLVTAPLLDSAVTEYGPSMLPLLAMYSIGNKINHH